MQPIHTHLHTWLPIDCDSERQFLHVPSAPDEDKNCQIFKDIFIAVRNVSGLASREDNEMWKHCSAHVSSEHYLLLLTHYLLSFIIYPPSWCPPGFHHPLQYLSVHTASTYVLLQHFSCEHKEW